MKKKLTKDYNDNTNIHWPDPYIPYRVYILHLISVISELIRYHNVVNDVTPAGACYSERCRPYCYIV